MDAIWKHGVGGGLQRLVGTRREPDGSTEHLGYRIAPADINIRTRPHLSFHLLPHRTQLYERLELLPEPEIAKDMVVHATTNAFTRTSAVIVRVSRSGA